MIRFSICGAASYACGELLRLMVNHPETQVAHLAARVREQLLRGCEVRLAVAPLVDDEHGLWNSWRSPCQK